MSPKKITSSTIILIITLQLLGLAICFDCNGKPNGVYESSCQSAVFCNNNTTRKLDCTIPKVVNEETGECDNALNVNTPCGTFRDCSIRDDGGYPDMESNCQWYYMCSYGILYGHHKCAAVIRTQDRSYCNLPALMGEEDFNCKPGQYSCTSNHFGRTIDIPCKPAEWLPRMKDI